MGLISSTILDTLLQIEILVQDFVKRREQISVLVADNSHCELQSVHDNAGDELPGHFFDRMRFLKKARISTPLLRALPKRLKWAIFYKYRYERQIINCENSTMS